MNYLFNGEMIPVRSTNVMRIGYDSAMKRLRVEYAWGDGQAKKGRGGNGGRNGIQSAYVYSNVEEWLWDSLKNAKEHVGQTLTMEIVKHPEKYPFVKVPMTSRADAPVIQSVVTGPVFLALEKTEKAIADKYFDRMLYILWVVCGKPNTADPGVGTTEQKLFSDCKALIAEASGKNVIDGKNVGRAKTLAREKGV